MNDTRTRLARCFSAVFPELNEHEIPIASMASVGNWDSLASATLITVLEEEFGVDIAPEDADQLVSFDLALDYLQRHEHQAS
jgi:acyl carrier protein